MSSKVTVPARRTTMLPPSSSHSRIEPGPTPSLRRTFTGTEIWPCAVTLDRAMGIVYITRVMEKAASPSVQYSITGFTRGDFNFDLDARIDEASGEHGGGWPDVTEVAAQHWPARLEILDARKDVEDSHNV